MTSWLHSFGSFIASTGNMVPGGVVDIAVASNPVSPWIVDSLGYFSHSTVNSTIGNYVIDSTSYMMPNGNEVVRTSVRHYTPDPF